jgi:hypothetical protein
MKNVYCVVLEGENPPVCELLYQNFREEDVREEEYLGGMIKAYRNVYEEFSKKKNKYVETKEVVCLVSLNGKGYNLGECSDGEPFTSVGQALKEGRIFVSHIMR